MLLLFIDIRAFSIYKGLTIKTRCHIWWRHRRSLEGRAIWKFIFSCSWINLRNSHTNSKEKEPFFSLFYFKLKLLWVHCDPPSPRQIWLSRISMKEENKSYESSGSKRQGELGVRPLPQYFPIDECAIFKAHIKDIKRVIIQSAYNDNRYDKSIIWLLLPIYAIGH